MPRGHGKGKHYIITNRPAIKDPDRGINMTADHMAAQAVAKPECALQVDHIAASQPAKISPRQTLRRDIHREPATTNGCGGKADTVHRNALAFGWISQIKVSRNGKHHAAAGRPLLCYPALA